MQRVSANSHAEDVKTHAALLRSSAPIFITGATDSSIPFICTVIEEF
jgi:hypothetical protein